MPRSIPLTADPTAIGNVAAPPFCRLPDPGSLFATRQDRLLFLGREHDLSAYLLFLAGIAGAQHAIVDGLPEPEPVAPDRLALAREHAMPPLDRAGFRRDEAATVTLDRFFDTAAAIEMPRAARVALENVRALGEDDLDVVLGNVLADAIPIDGVAEHVFAAAALQVHFARLASRLPGDGLRPIGETLCPGCGGPPVASMVVGWPGAETTRFCACPLCATLWHYVRVRCTACGSTKGVGLQAVEGAPDTFKAETCTECNCYAKVFYQNRDAAIEPLADDVATLGLDLLMRDGPFRRASYNPFLVGY